MYIPLQYADKAVDTYAMKFIGHTSTAIILTAPMIHFRHGLKNIDSSQLSDYQLLVVVGLFSVLPDIDIILSRFTPIKHRGYITHSLFSLIITALIFAIGWLLLAAFPEEIIALLPTPEIHLELSHYFTPFIAFLAITAVFAHIMGDSLTKTGIPLLVPGRSWHMPVIGGYAAYDNWALNIIPCIIAGFILEHWFGLGAKVIPHLGNIGLPL